MNQYIYKYNKMLTVILCYILKIFIAILSLEQLPMKLPFWWWLV